MICCRTFLTIQISQDFKGGLVGLFAFLTRGEEIEEIDAIRFLLEKLGCGSAVFVCCEVLLAAAASAFNAGQLDVMK